MQVERQSSGDYPAAAFTLIDLAVLIAVIAILSLLALAAEAKPRSRAYLMTDLNNHRALLRAVNSFANDHNGYLPNPGWGTTQINWLSGSNFPSAPANGTFLTYRAYYPQQLASLTNGQLFPYVQDPRVFMCPADAPDNPTFYSRAIYVCSYWWNGAVNGYGQLYNSTPSSYQLAQFRPDAILEWEADHSTPFFFNDFSAYPDEGISGRHSPETLVGEFSGGVTPVTLAAWYSRTMAGTQGSRGSTVTPLPNRVWCNPGRPDGRF